MKRARKRLGLPAKAVLRQANRAWTEGLPPEALDKRMQDYLLSMVLREDKKAVEEARLYGDFVYLFAGGQLVTVYPPDPRLYSETPNYKPDRDYDFRARRLKRGR